MDGVECGDCRTWKEELYWNRFHSFYFCLNLSSVTEFHKHLEIPKKFAENARTLLPPKVTLRGPSRALWSAIMTKRGDDLLLIEGWEEFVRAYSLQASDILIFKFDGVSTFDILIFDGENLCEKESAYFVKKCSHENAETPRNTTSGEAGIEEQTREEVVVDETPSGSKYTHFYSRLRKKRLRKAMSSKSSPRKTLFPLKMSNNAAGNGQSNDVQQNTNMNGSPTTETPNRTSPSEIQGSFSTKTPPTTLHINESILPEATHQKVAKGVGRPRKVIGSLGTQTNTSSSKLGSSVGRKRKQPDSNQVRSPHPSRYVSEEGILALQMAQKQMKENSLIVLMRPTSVCKRFILTLPPAWCRKHLSTRSQDVFFRFGDRTFLTKLSYTPKKSAGQICGGWKKVVVANRLKLFDVCLLNIISQKDDAVMFDVSVFRGGLQLEPVHPPSTHMTEPSMVGYVE